MYIATNRFQIANDFREDFVMTWKNRDSYLKDVPGFREFKLLKGPSDETSTVFISHSTWESQEDFDAWRNSELFKKSHAQARAPKGTYLSHPKFEGYDVILSE